MIVLSLVKGKLQLTVVSGACIHFELLVLFQKFTNIFCCRSCLPFSAAVTAAVVYEATIIQVSLFDRMINRLNTVTSVVAQVFAC